MYQSIHTFIRSFLFSLKLFLLWRTLGFAHKKCYRLLLRCFYSKRLALQLVSFQVRIEIGAMATALEAVRRQWGSFMTIVIFLSLKVREFSSFFINFKVYSPQIIYGLDKSWIEMRWANNLYLSTTVLVIWLLKPPRFLICKRELTCEQACNFICQFFMVFIEWKLIRRRFSSHQSHSNTIQDVQYTFNVCKNIRKYREYPEHREKINCWGLSCFYLANCNIISWG